MEVKERPILFKAEMVNAILDGRKTQTRRIIDWKRLHKQAGLSFPSKCHLAWFDILGGWGIHGKDDCLREVKCPQGKPGDRLWVRETFCFIPDSADGMGDQHYFRANQCNETGEQHLKNIGVKWKPSIFMPRKICRILLEITDIRVERLNDITEAGASAEGAVSAGLEAALQANADEGYPIDQTIELGDMAVGEFNKLWESIHGKGSWNLNPWVWVIEFKKLTDVL